MCQSLKANTGKKETKQNTRKEGDIKSTIIFISYNSQNIPNYISTENYQDNLLQDNPLPSDPNRMKYIPKVIKTMIRKITSEQVADDVSLNVGRVLKISVSKKDCEILSTVMFRSIRINYIGKRQKRFDRIERPDRKINRVNDRSIQIKEKCMGVRLR